MGRKRKILTPEEIQKLHEENEEEARQNLIELLRRQIKEMRPRMLVVSETKQRRATRKSPKKSTKR